MNEDEQVRTWYKVGHANGRTYAKVTVQQGNVSASWSVKTYASAIPEGMREARRFALKALADIKATIEEFETDG
jgi:hypothetical protein